MNVNDFLNDILNTKSFLTSWKNNNGDEQYNKVFKDLDNNNYLKEHTLKVLDNYLSNNNTNDLTILAIIFHDIGKLYTSEFIDGRYHFYGHQQKSKELYLELKDNFDLSNEDLEYVEKMIEYHDYDIGKQLLRPVYKSFGDDFLDEFIKLKYSDASAHKEPKKSINVNKVNDYLKKLNQIKNELIFENNQILLNDKLKENKYEIDDLKEIQKLFKLMPVKSLNERDVNLFLLRYDEAKKSNMLNISEFDKTRDESKGVTEKLWIDVNGKEALFKITQFRNDDTHINAHYSELFVSRLCNFLNIPASKIELAYNSENIGCISYNFLEKDDKMFDFNEILSDIRPDFDSKKLLAVNSNDTYSVPLILEGLESKSKNLEEFNSLKKSFFNYCLFYSLIEHYDVNPSNISLIENKDGVKLAPIFDNGTSINLSIPVSAVRENLSNDWLSIIRSKNLSKIGSNKGRCTYDELETYIFSTYYSEVTDFLDTIKNKLTKKNINEILVNKSFDGLSDVYKDMICSMIINNCENMLERASLYKDKYMVETLLSDKNTRQLSMLIKEGTLDNIIPNISKLTDIPQRGIYHIHNVLDYLTNCLESVDKSSLSKEEKNILKWTFVFNNVGKINTHKEINKDGNIIDSFKNYSYEGVQIAEKIMDNLNFLPEDKKLITSLINSHNYRSLNSEVTAKHILKTVGERYLNLFLIMKDIETKHKSPTCQKETYKQLYNLRNNIENQLSFNNREIISVLPIKSKAIMSMGIMGEDIGLIQNSLANYIRKESNIYEYYKARGHLDRYKKDLNAYTQYITKEFKLINNSSVFKDLINNEKGESLNLFLEQLKVETDNKKLSKFLNSKFDIFKLAISENSNLSEQLINQLANDNNLNVRKNIVMNIATSFETSSKIINNLYKNPFEVVSLIENCVNEEKREQIMTIVFDRLKNSNLEKYIDIELLEKQDFDTKINKFKSLENDINNNVFLFVEKEQNFYLEK